LLLLLFEVGELIIITSPIMQLQKNKLKRKYLRDYLKGEIIALKVKLSQVDAFSKMYNFVR
jgi:hypothetical protein